MADAGATGEDEAGLVSRRLLLGCSLLVATVVLLAGLFSCVYQRRKSRRRDRGRGGVGVGPGSVLLIDVLVVGSEKVLHFGGKLQDDLVSGKHALEELLEHVVELLLLGDGQAATALVGALGFHPEGQRGRVVGRDE